MTEKQKMIEEFFDNAGFTERILIGLHEGKRIYFHADFTEALANGLVTMALMDDNIHQGLKRLKHTLEAILDGVDGMTPDNKDSVH